MKRLLSLIIILGISVPSLLADEGMWLPLLLQKVNEKKMQQAGMKITAEDIYSINKSSLKDAVMIFGGGCTGELISGDGLLITNHHCGYGEIQAHSSVEHDYLSDGFWAMNREEELPNPGLTVSFMKSMEDVTSFVLNGVKASMNQKERETLLRKRIKVLTDSLHKSSGLEAVVEKYYYGNQWFVILYEDFKDVRLVGAPPSSIGKFGGDTDNWMWPRHTGDFSLFRIYANKENKPAAYSKDNVPYKPERFYTISLKGVNEGDFTMVYGYPGRTEEYLPSQAIRLQVDEVNPIRISLRDKRLDIMNRYAAINDTIRIQYAAKNAGVANGWKKWIGESKGINRMNGVSKKEAFEARFNDWSATASGMPYKEVLNGFESLYKPYNYWKRSEVYFQEAGLSAEIVRLALRFRGLVQMSQQKDSSDIAVKREAIKLKQSLDEFYKDYSVVVDKDIFISMLDSYYAAGNSIRIPAYLVTLMDKEKGASAKLVADMFASSILPYKDKTYAFLDNYKRKRAKQIEKDPFYRFAKAMVEFSISELQPITGKFNRANDSLMRIYMAGQMEMQKDRDFYPDANFTLRVAYGNVKGFTAADAKNYRYYTTLDGIMEKGDIGAYDYVVDPKLRQLWLNKDYGQFADKTGELRTCFIATNHTTGGNSGSPVLDAEGRLIGVNFDRCWEGTMSDLMYDPMVCRNIALDIRYALFIIDRFAGAGHLLKEMRIEE